MPSHRLKVGQTVVAPSEGRDVHIPRGPLVIVRLLPLVDGQPQYRARSGADGLDRVVLERQIRLAEDWSPREPSPPKRAGRWVWPDHDAPGGQRPSVVRRQVWWLGAAGSGSPSLTCTTQPVGVPKTFNCS
jgi:hypothetical protein